MSNLTSGSIEYFPIIGQGQKPNKVFRQSIIGAGNNVEPTAQDIIVNGFGNYIGEECRNINLLNTSACIVSSGIIGVNLFSCSGLVINDSDTIYIRNVLITEDSFSGGGSIPSSGVTYSESYTIAGGDYDVLLADSTIVNFIDGNTFYLPVTAGQTQKFNLKNLSSQTLVIDFIDTSVKHIDGDPNLVPLLLNYRDSVTLQSNGSNGYIIL